MATEGKNSSVVPPHDGADGGAVGIRGEGDDHNIIADVLSEVNGFIDSLDQGESFNGQYGHQSAAANGGGYYDPVNDGEELFSIMSSGQIQTTSATQVGITGNAAADERSDARAVGADAANESRDIFSTRIGHYEKLPETNADAVKNVVDEEHANKIYSRYDQNSGEDGKGLGVFGLARESEDLYNTINQSYNDMDDDGHSSNIVENALSPDSISGSANSGEGSSVENKPPPSQQQNQQKLQHTPSYHQNKIQQRAHEHQQHSQKKKLYDEKQHKGGSLFSQLPILDQRNMNNALSSQQGADILNNTNNAWAASYANRMGIQQKHEAPQQSTTAASAEMPIPSSRRVMSPFSANARQLWAQGIKSQNNASMSFGLQHCRKVSLFLKVRPHPLALAGEGELEQSRDSVDEDGYGPILFPALISEEAVRHVDDSVVVARGVQEAMCDESKESQLRHGEVILVNPNAFDAEDEGSKSSTMADDKSKKRIAGRVTVETARLVAEVSQISSEDWARKYLFDDVSWPRHCKSFPSSASTLSSKNIQRFSNNDEHSCDSLSALAKAAVEDVLSLSSRKMDRKDNYIPCSSVVCAVGGHNSGKTTTVFGSTIARLVSTATRTTTSNIEKDGDSQDLGLLGEMISGILSSTQQNRDSSVYSSYPGGKIVANGHSTLAVKCSLSILEIEGDDVLRDILGFSEGSSNEHGGTQALRIRHLDKRGASVLNLRQVTIESMGQLHQLVRESFKYNPLRKLWGTEGGHGHFIASICVSRPNGSAGDCAKIQLVDLASPDRHHSSAVSLSSVRKSLSALRGVLREVIQHDNSNSHEEKSPSFSSPIPFRESTLTKLLQRSLDDQHQDCNGGVGVPTTRTVVIGTVCPSSKNYNQTLGTIDFMTRLWSKPGDTAQSVFLHNARATTTKKVGNHDDAGKNASQLQEQDQSQQLEIQSIHRKPSSIMAHPQEALQRKASLKSLTSDPRQRIAKLLNTAPRAKPVTTKGAAEKGGAHNHDGTPPPKNSNVTSGKPMNNEQELEDSYGNVFDQLDSLMDASDDGSIDRNSYGDEIIDALTPYKTGRTTNDGSSIESSEGVTPSPFYGREYYLGSGELEQKQHEEQRRLHDLFHGVMERKGSLFQEREHSAAAVDDPTHPQLRTEIEFYQHPTSDSSHHTHVSMLGNEDDMKSLHPASDNGGHHSSHGKPFTQALDLKSHSNNAKHSHDRSDNGNPSENYFSEGLPSNQPHLQTKGVEPCRSSNSSWDHINNNMKSSKALVYPGRDNQSNDGSSSKTDSSDRLRTPELHAQIEQVVPHQHITGTPDQVHGTMRFQGSSNERLHDQRTWQSNDQTIDGGSRKMDSSERVHTAQSNFQTGTVELHLNSVQGSFEAPTLNSKPDSYESEPSHDHSNGVSFPGGNEKQAIIVKDGDYRRHQDEVQRATPLPNERRTKDDDSERRRYQASDGDQDDTKTRFSERRRYQTSDGDQDDDDSERRRCQTSDGDQDGDDSKRRRCQTSDNDQLWIDQRYDADEFIYSGMDNPLKKQPEAHVQTQVACHRRSESDKVDALGNKKDLDESSFQTWSHPQTGEAKSHHHPMNSTKDEPSIAFRMAQPITTSDKRKWPDENSQKHSEKDDRSLNDASRANVPVLVKKSDMAPLSIPFSPDSMYSEEPLVSSKSTPAFFYDSPQQSLPVNSVDAPHSPTYTMFESFKLEIDSLVDNLTSPRASNEVTENAPTAHVPECPLQAAAICNDSDRSASVEDRLGHSKSSALENEVALLKLKVQALNDEKKVSKNFLSNMQSIMDGHIESQTLSNISPSSSWPGKAHKDFEGTIRERETLLINLRCQLEVSQAESAKLSTELDHAESRISGLSQTVDDVEEDLAEAKGTIDYQARASAALESEIASLKERLDELSTKDTSSSVFFGQLDALVGNSNDGASDCDESQHTVRLDNIKNLQLRLKEVLKKLEESLEREQLAKNTSVELGTKVQELENQTRTYQESCTRMEAKRIETEKLAEEAISAHEILTSEVADLQSKLVKSQNNYEALLTIHNSALGDNEKISAEYEKGKALLEERDREISGVKGSLHASHKEKMQLEHQLASIRIKTVDAMKQRIETLQADYMRRLENFKTSHLEQEDEELSRLKLDLSRKEADNTNLKRRIEQIEKSTSLTLANTKESLIRVQGELDSASSGLLEAREEKKELQSELDHLRGLMDIAEESISELNHLKEENKQLNEMISSRNEQDSRMSNADVFEIRRATNDNSFFNDDSHFMHERISALMRENEQNCISMRTLVSENVALKSSIEECTSTIQLMHSEMNELKTITTTGLSKMRTREKSLFDEHRKDRDAITEMETKLENANNLIRSLRSSSSRYYNAQGAGFASNLNPHNSPLINRLKTPEEQPSAYISRVEDYRALASGSTFNGRKFSAELSTEKELRFKAEEICAGVLANSKAALEERDSEISKLRSQLFNISSKRYRGDR